MPGIELAEIQHRRRQVLRQRKEIMQLNALAYPARFIAVVQSQRNRAHLEPNICCSLTAASSQQPCRNHGS